MSSAGVNPTSGPARALVLAEFAPYRIVSLGHAISAGLAHVYADENLTIPEWRVLAVISQAMTVAARDVVSLTPMDKMTVSRAVASLEAKGFVQRQTDDDDRRVNSLSLSPSGRALFDRIAALALRFEDDMLSALSGEERQVFLDVIGKLEGRAAAPAAANGTA